MSPSDPNDPDKTPPLFGDPGGWFTIPDENPPPRPTPPFFDIIVCECGAASIGIADFAPGHSSWCPVRESR